MPRFTPRISNDGPADAAQEYIANKLQKAADRLGTEKAALLKEKAELQRQARPISQELTSVQVAMPSCRCVAQHTSGRLQCSAHSMCNAPRAVSGRVGANARSPA